MSPEERANLKTEAKKLGIIFESQAMEKVLKIVQNVAPLVSKPAVLIAGASGVGKELVATALHEWSNHADKPLVIVNSASLSSPASDVNMLNSKLFGHVKNSFNYATDRIGYFEQANEGTIFFDELGTMSLEAQVNLLRVIEGHPFHRVGDDKDIKVNVSVVTATNIDLKQAVAKKQFRVDMYNRVSGFPIHIPPLYERKEDIVPLANYFFKIFIKENNLSAVTHISQEALDYLESARWPGNVRELKSIVGNAIIHAISDETSSQVELKHFPSDLPLAPSREASPPETDTQEVTGTDSVLTIALDYVMNEREVDLGNLEEDYKNYDKAVLYTVDALIRGKIKKLNALDKMGASKREEEGFVGRTKIRPFVDKYSKCFFGAELKPGEFIDRCKKIYRQNKGNINTLVNTLAATIREQIGASDAPPDYLVKFFVEEVCPSLSDEDNHTTLTPNEFIAQCREILQQRQQRQTDDAIANEDAKNLPGV